MMEWDTAEYSVTLFVLCSWLAATVGTSVLLVLYKTARWNFCRPAIVLLAAANVLMQWPAAILAPYIEGYLTDYWTVFFLVHCYVVVGLAVVPTMLRADYQLLWKRLTASELGTIGPLPALLLVCCAVGCLAFYLSAVPLTETGLVVAIVSPELANAARDASLRGLESSLVAYVFTLYVTTVGPLLAVSTAIATQRWLRKGRIGLAVIGWLAIAVIAITMSVTGARSFAVMLLVAIGVAMLLRQQLRINPTKLMVGGIIVLLPAVVLTLTREGLDLDVGLILQYLGNILFERVLQAPIEVGVWYLHYVQSAGYFGISAVPKLAAVVGVGGVDVPSLIGAKYAPQSVGSIVANANGSFIVTYFSYFGPIAFAINLCVLVLLDGAVYLYRKLPNELLLPVVATTSTAVLALLSADFHSALLSNGLILVPSFALALGAISKPAT